MKKYFLIIMCCLFILLGCSSPNVDKIKGHWISDDDKVELYLNDDEYNTAKLINQWTEKTGTYEIDGDSLKLSFSSEEVIVKFELDGDTLRIIDPSDSDDVSVYFRED